MALGERTGPNRHGVAKVCRGWLGSERLRVGARVVTKSLFKRWYPGTTKEETLVGGAWGSFIRIVLVNSFGIFG